MSITTKMVKLLQQVWDRHPLPKFPRAARDPLWDKVEPVTQIDKPSPAPLCDVCGINAALSDGVCFVCNRADKSPE